VNEEYIFGINRLYGTINKNTVITIDLFSPRHSNFAVYTFWCCHQFRIFQQNKTNTQIIINLKLHIFYDFLNSHKKYNSVLRVRSTHTHTSCTHTWLCLQFVFLNRLKKITSFFHSSFQNIPGSLIGAVVVVVVEVVVIGVVVGAVVVEVVVVLGAVVVVVVVGFIVVEGTVVVVGFVVKLIMH